MSPIRLTFLAFLFAALAATGTLYAQTAWYEGFERGETSWYAADANARQRFLEHRRIQGDAHTGQGCEWLSLSANEAFTVQIAHDVGRPRVIDELMPSVWVKSDRAGLQIAARIVLPRTTDPQSGRPIVAVIAGTSYADAGRWQELRITDVPRLLAQQIRLLRTQLGPNVDGHEAFVEAVLLNVQSGPGVTNVWIDDLDIAGYAAAPGAAQARSASPAPRVGNNIPGPGDWVPKGNSAGPEFPNATGRDAAKDVALGSVPAAGRDFSRGDASRAAPFAPIQPQRHDVKLSGSILTVDNRPFFPRAIEHQGEPLLLLKQLGFNAVWLKRLPTPEILEEAARLGLWVICPPPRPQRSADGGHPADLLNEIGPAFDAVLLWDLGSDLGPANLDAARRWAAQIRSADRRGARPLICQPGSEFRGYSRLDNSIILLIDRRPLGTSMELVDYGLWVRRQPLLALPGTPIWTTVQTQANDALRRQIAALEPANTTPPTISYDQMRLLTLTAAASGSRGLLFLSSSPLDANDADTRARALALQLLNLELELVEPWAAGGSYMTTAAAGAEEVTAPVLRSERARLVLPIWYSPGAQCVPAQAMAKNLTLVVPGVPESAAAYELGASGLKPLGHKRVTGGMRVSLEQFGLAAQVLLAHDPLVVNSMVQRSAKISQKAAQLQRDLAVRKLYMVQMIGAQMGQRSSASAAAASWIDAARKGLQWCDAQLAARDYASASTGACRAMGYLRWAERFFWEDAVRELASPVTSPAALSFDTLPCHWRLIGRIRAARFGPNQLVGGDFENLNLMLQAGWRHLKTPAPGVQSAADLLSGSAHGGAMGLRLLATADDPENPPAMLESPPVRFVSPSVLVGAGQIVCIHGWVNVPNPIAGSVDGLMIYDSLGGEALADRIGHTTGWKQFALYRAASQSAAVNVTFALSGLGEAWIDDVQVQVLDASPAGLTTR